MKLKTKLKIRILGNLLASFGCILGFITCGFLLGKILFGVAAFLGFFMVSSDFDKYPTED